MGVCRFCGKSVGSFRKAHKECKAAHKLATLQIVKLVQSAVEGPEFNNMNLHKQIELMAISNYVNENEVSYLLFKGWELAVRSAIEKADFTEKTKVRIAEYTEILSLSQHSVRTSQLWKEYSNSSGNEELRDAKLAEKRKLAKAVSIRKLAREADARKSEVAKVAAARGRKMEKVATARDRTQTQQMRKARILRDLEIGRLTKPNLAKESTPFVLQKTEKLVWVFENAEYLKEVVVQRRNYSGWHDIPTVYGMVSVDRGAMGVTTKHIYFVGDKERFRIRFDRIVAYKKYPDGVGLNRGAEQARHQRFVTGEGWFTYNLVSTLAKLY